MHGETKEEHYLGYSRFSWASVWPTIVDLDGIECCYEAPPVKRFEHPYIVDWDDIDVDSLPDLELNGENQIQNNNDNNYYIEPNGETTSESTSSSTSDYDTSTITEGTPLPSSSDEPLIIKPKQCQII